MDIQDLRETRERLQEIVDYCPPDNASDLRWQIAIEKSDVANDQLRALDPTFALLDEIDRLAARMEQMKKRFKAWVDTSPINKDYESCFGE